MSLIRGKIAGLGVLAVVLLAAGSFPAQAQTTLRYKFKEGEKLNYVMEQKMTMQMNVMGQDVEMNMTQTIDLTWQIQSVDKDGRAKLTQKFDRVRFKMEGGQVGKVEYDSMDGKEPEGPIGKAIGPIFGALAGSEIGMTMDARGQIADVKIPDKFSDALKNAGAGAAGLGEMFSEDGMKRMMSQGGLVVPAEAVTKGKTWNQNVDMKMPIGKMKVDTTYTYDGQTTKGNKKLEQVPFKAKVTLEPSDNAALTVKLKEQSAKGSAQFDADAGRLVETSMTQEMEMEIGAGGQNITQKIKQEVTMKLQDKAK